MGRRGRARRSHLLSAAVGRGSRDPALLHHDRDRAGPSFQMSFAATLALIAAYQYGLPWRAKADTSLGARVALWGGREIAGLILASLVAGLATTPYAAYHFHRAAPYGVIANLLAMPVVSAEVMPMGILGLLAMPFGFDAVFWKLMDADIDWMDTVALWVTSLPGAVGHVRAFGTGPLLLGTAAILLLCLLRTPLRWSGAVLTVIASLWAVTTPLPDVLVAGDGQTAAIRGGDGRLAVLHSNRDSFAIKEWLPPSRAAGPAPAARAALRSCTAIATVSRSRNGSPPTAMRAPSRMRPCMTACSAMPPAASGGSPTAGWCRTPYRWKLSRRIARAPPWWSARARRRAPAMRC